jgi:hypothetical protein
VSYSRWTRADPVHLALDHAPKLAAAINGKDLEFDRPIKFTSIQSRQIAIFGTRLWAKRDAITKE